MKYAGTVVLYNPVKKEVLHNIQSYINQLDVLFVVDNSSSDNSDIFTGLEKVVYIPQYQNKGIAEALNIAANKTIEQGYKWLLTMDQDSCFDGDTITILQNQIEKEMTNEDRIGIVSPFHNTLNSVKNNSTRITKPIIVMTSGNFIYLPAYQEINGFKDWLFIDCVDFDYCLNLINHNYEIIQVNDAILHHELGEMTKRKIGKKEFYCDNHNYIRRYYIVRNRHYIYDMYHKYFPAYCEAEIKCTRKEVYKIVLGEKDKIRKLYYMYKGYRDYKKGKKGILQ